MFPTVTFPKPTLAGAKESPGCRLDAALVVAATMIKLHATTKMNRMEQAILDFCILTVCSTFAFSPAAGTGQGPLRC